MSTNPGCAVKGLLKTYFATKGKSNQLSSVPVVAEALAAGMPKSELMTVGLDDTHFALIDAWRVVKNKAAISLDLAHDARVEAIRRIAAHFGVLVPESFK